ncbi:MAG: TolC family protein [Chitinophagales bacterium]
MKKLLFLFCLLQLSNIQAQRTNFDRIVIPTDQITRDYKEALVQLAWVNNPDNKVLEHEVNIAEIEKKAAKWTWADNVQASFNLNEGNFQKETDPGGNLFFPKYNFSASVSIGSLLRTSSETKKAEQQLDIAHHRVNQRKLQIRAETLKRYEDYLTAVEMLKLRTQAVEDFYATYLAVTKKFKESRSSLEEYNQASTTYYTALENKLRGESDVELAKISLEEIIGVKLEEVRVK